MGKGGGGGGGSTHVSPPQALNQTPTSVIPELGQLGLAEQQFLFGSGMENLGPQGQQLMGTNMLGSKLNPLQTQESAIGTEQGLAPQYQHLIDQSNNLSSFGTQQLEQGYADAATAKGGVAAAQGGVTAAENQIKQLEQGTGLYKSQQAYVDQAVKSGQAAVQQQMASEGLTSSTQNAMLQNQVAQSGAATAGQLTQGNIQLGQAGEQLAQTNVSQAQNEQQLVQEGVKLAQQLTLGEGALSASNVQALNSMWSNVAQQSGGINAQNFLQAVQGYGVLGSFFNQIGSTYGVELQGIQLQLEQELGQANINAGITQSENSAASSGKSSMMGGLGSIMGKGGGSGGSGGLLGGLFGAGAGAAGGAAALGLGTAGGSISSGVGALALLATV